MKGGVIVDTQNQTAPQKTVVQQVIDNEPITVDGQVVVDSLTEKLNQATQENVLLHAQNNVLREEIKRLKKEK